VQAIVAALALVPVSLLPALDLLAGPIYIVGALLLSGIYVYYSTRFVLERSEVSARQLLRASLVYLPALLALFMLVPLI
jgi:protoheme IX farnesyltransferase